MFLRILTGSSDVVVKIGVDSRVWLGPLLAMSFCV